MAYVSKAAVTILLVLVGAAVSCGHTTTQPAVPQQPRESAPWRHDRVAWSRVHG